MLGTTEHHVKHSRDLAEFMKDFTLAEDEEFVLHDVVAFFTNTPIPETLQYIKAELTKDNIFGKFIFDVLQSFWYRRIGEEGDNIV